jgi:nucleotide-binding universal stress UspA family protein
MAASHRIRRLLVPVDGSEHSRNAAEQAVRVAESQGAEIVFLHVVDPQVAAELEGLSLDGDTLGRLRGQGRAFLEDAARLADEHGLAHREELAEGDPAAVICDVAAREDVDVIVVGRLGRRGARRILMGSITRRVIESGERPVLVVMGPPRDGEERSRGRAPGSTADSPEHVPGTRPSRDARGSRGAA